MKLLLIGSGGREHALAWKFNQSPQLKEIFVAPGNPGTAKLSKVKNIPIAAENLEELLSFAKKNSIDLTFVGPEKPLALGIVDLFRKNGLKIFGPEQKASRLESSKEYAKQIMVEASVPTASYEVFGQLDPLLHYLEKIPYPVVLKADGLAAGKGVAVCKSRDEAVAFSKQIFIDKVFGDSGNRVVVEEFLSGRECSILAISDGNTYQLLASAQDHKRLLDKDQGPNTGGMGAYSPSPIFDEKLEKTVHEKIFQPVFQTLQKKGMRFTGILYAGLMVGKNGVKVLEFNVRFGDPETQVILPRMKNDFFTIAMNAANGELSKETLQWNTDSCVTVVLAAKGYPDKPEKGKIIEGLSSSGMVFHAGTAQQNDKIVTAGGRVLNVTNLGKTMQDARSKTYAQISEIHFDGMQFRKDIGES